VSDDPHSYIETAPDHGKRSPATVKSAGRALQVLEYFEMHRAPAKAIDIAKDIGMPQSSASMLLRSLVELGYLTLDSESRTYLPSPRVTLLGAWLDGGPIRDGSLLRAVEHLSDRTRDAVFMATRSGIYAQYIHITPARTALRFHISVGSRRLLVKSSTGFTLLSRMSDKQIRAILHRTNAEQDGPNISLDETMASVEMTRKQGYFFSREMVTPGAGAIAMLLPSNVDQCNRDLSICIGGMLADMEQKEEELVAEMRHTISRFLVHD